MLLDPVTGWLTGVLGEAGVKMVRGSSQERELRQAVIAAVEAVVERAPEDSQQALRQGLALFFTRPPAVRIDASTPIGEGLRAAVAAQIGLLDQVVNEGGVPFFIDAGVDRDWLTGQVTGAFMVALQQVVAASEPDELVQALRFEQLSVTIDGLARQVSRLQAPEPVPVIRTLPPDVVGFTGRDVELARLSGMLEEVTRNGGMIGIHAIAGMAGVGKTTFAIHAAHRLAHRFPDGQLWVPLHGHTLGRNPVDPSDALGRLLLTQGMRSEQIPTGLDERSALWRHHLADKQVLLVLDDATGSSQVRPLLPATPDCLVLITSRRALTGLDGAEPVSLDVLPPDDAAAMFVRLARRPDLPLDDEGVVRLVRMCGYLPLAISLMAGRLRHKNPALWDAAHLVDELETAQDRLSDLATEDRSVAAAFDLSYNDLTPGSQALFQFLGLHPGVGMDVYVTAALADIPLHTARHGLEELTEHHLLRETTAPGSYIFHELIRHHARTLAAGIPSAERDAAVLRLLDYYWYAASQAARHFTYFLVSVPPPVPPAPATAPDLTDRERARAWLETHHADITAAIEYAAIQQPPRAHAHALPAALADYMNEHFDRRSADALHRIAFNAAQTLDDLAAQAGAFNNIGWVHRLLDEYEAATASLEQALRLYREIDDPRRQAVTLNNLGIVQRLRGDYEAVIASAEQALRLNQDLNDRRGQAHTLAVRDQPRPRQAAGRGGRARRRLDGGHGHRHAARAHLEQGERDAAR